jgi:class 3 adenylate cyclase/tetratricopeptide (TPR) repeat protein
MDTGTDAQLMRGERRIISVLFADIVGSTAHINTLDPEDAQDFLDEILHRMIENVHAHGGSITQTLGDGVMAVFGAPAPNEDHALCACLAGMAIRDSLETRGKDGARVRIGIHSGPAIIRWGGNDFGRELKSVGSTVHVAARIEKMCPENSVAISSVTSGLTAASLKSRKLGQVRDAADTVSVVELIGVKAQQNADRRIRGRTPNRLVGRNAELIEISRVIRATQDGRSGDVAFVGEAGLGKSRLAHEVQVRAIRANVACETIRGFAANTATPFAALRPLALRLLGRESEADAGPVFDRLRDHGLDRRAVLGLLALAGRAVEEDPEWIALSASDRNRAIVDGGTRALLSLARSQPLLLIVEDIHFLDNETISFIRNIGHLRSETSFGLVATTRPEKHEFVRSICSRVVDLSPLEPAAARKLAEAEIGAALADEQDSRHALVDAVVSRAGGIPLALEEFARTIRAARDGRSLRQSMPISMENAFNTRLGQLSNEARGLAQAASVLGGEFDLKILLETADIAPSAFSKHLAGLIDQRFLELVDEGSARFSHQLMQETCYAFTAKAQRQTLHAAAHRASLASTDPRHRVSQELARHALGAGERQQALKHLWDACAEAMGRAAIQSVVSLYRQAKAVCNDIGPSADLDAAKFTLLVFDAFQQLGEQEELAEALDQAKGAMLAAKNARGAVQAEIHLAMTHWIGGRHKQGLICAQRARESAGEFLPLQVYAEFTLANLEFANGFAFESTARFRQLIASLAGELATTRFGIAISIPGSMARAFASWYLCYIGGFEEAERYQSELAASAQQLDHQYSRLLGLTALGFIKLRSGTPNEAVETLSVAHELCWSGDFHGREPCISAWYAQALLEQGRIGLAQSVLARSVARGNYEKIRNVNRYYVRETQAKVHARLGDLEAALASAQEAIDVAESNYDPIHLAHGRYVKAQIHVARAEHDQARQELDLGAEAAERLGLTVLSTSIAQMVAAL